MRERPILVTGAAGLIGRRVVEMLAADGRATRATDRTGAADETIETIAEKTMEENTKG